MSTGKQFKRKLAASRTRAEIEKEALAEKAARQQEYSEKVNALLAEGNCGLATICSTVEIGGAAVTVDKVLVLPTQIIVVAN